MSPGRLFGVGVGPGDPELVTVKARRIIEAADVIAYPIARRRRGVARQVVAPYLHEGHIEVALTYPVTTEDTEHPGGYEGALRGFYDTSAETLAAHLDAGRDVAVLCEGDPFFYGSYMYLHERLAHRYETEVVPGVTSFSAAAAAAGTPLARRDDVLTVLPGTLPPDVLAARLRTSDAAVVLKLGRTFGAVREAAERAGVAARASYVERASSEQERTASLRAVDGEVPYMSLVLVPTAVRAERNGHAGSVSVVGIGPAGPDWLTPEAQAELAVADELIGYQTYLARVPERHGQRRHATDNRVEAERARHALELARGGARVAVVSSGDPRPSTRHTSTCRCGWCPACPPCRRLRRGSARRSGTTSAWCRCRTSSSRGRWSSAACRPPRRRTSCSRSTTRHRRRDESSFAARSRCSVVIALR